METMDKVNIRCSPAPTGRFMIAAIRFASMRKMIEYFLYKEDIGEEIVEAGLQAEDLLDELYHVYLKYEWMQITSWEKIEEILAVYIREKR